MKKLSVFVAILLFLLTGIVSAQTKAQLEIRENPLLSASNYVAYIDPTVELTKAPKGYEPFYLTHYGRHGSRWLLADWQYNEVKDVLQRAHEAGELTEKGEKLYIDYCLKFQPTIYKRLGELTNVGERQHHRIGKRMAERFPEIFQAKGCEVDARSTVVIRCILSMEAECEELAAANPKIRFHNDVSEAFQYYLNQDWNEELSREERARKKEVFDYRREYLHPERFWASIFKNPDYRDPVRKSRTEFMERLFKICSNMQSHGSVPGLQAEDPTLSYKNQSPVMNFYGYFTEDEIYNLWKCQNISWYVSYVAGNAPKTQSNLLRNFIETADTIVGQKDYHGATLRFGHEVCVMPMAALLELGNSGVQMPLSEMARLDEEWANYRIFPMGSNIQLVFYRPKNGKGDILVKGMLNEREVTLPGKPVTGCYYKWSELREYYLNKIK